MIKQAIILAGGKGERLRPLTNDRPKPMVEINGKPIIAYQVEKLKKAGIEEIVFACSYMHDVIEEYFGDGSKFGVKAIYSIEETPKGRGGGIKQAMNKLSEGWKEVLVMNGDILWAGRIEDLVKQHEERGAIVTILVSPLVSPYGIVDINEDNEVLGFREKPILDQYWINAGFYVFSNEIYDLMPDIGDHETETFPKLPKDRFVACKSNDYWKGVDTIKDRSEAEKEVKEVFK